MVEVMVAVIVASIGLLAMAMMMTMALRGNQSSNFRAQAAIFAADILDAMRANRANAANYVIDFGAGPPAGATVAQRDLNQWLTRINQTLPAGEGRIQFNPGTRTVTVQVRWTDARFIGGAALDQFTFTSRI